MLPGTLELRDGSVLGSRGTGSFDCVAARFADGNFAQDDRDLVLWGVQTAFASESIKNKEPSIDRGRFLGGGTTWIFKSMGKRIS